MEDKLLSFRQPIVTATGIILGFILNFASSFVKSDNSIAYHSRMLFLYECLFAF